jgi:hypothetical protein
MTRFPQQFGLTKSSKPSDFQRLPPLPDAFGEIARRHGDFALVSAAAAVESRNGQVQARVALGGVGPRPAAFGCDSFTQQQIAPSEFEAFGRYVSEHIEPNSDFRRRRISPRRGGYACRANLARRMAACRFGKLIMISVPERVKNDLRGRFEIGCQARSSSSSVLSSFRFECVEALDGPTVD